MDTLFLKKHFTDGYMKNMTYYMCILIMLPVNQYSGFCSNHSLNKIQETEDKKLTTLQIHVNK